MNTPSTNFKLVCTVPREREPVYHDGSTSYLDWLTNFEQRKNTEYLERLDKQEQEERMQRAFAESLRPKRKKSAKLSSVVGW